jgi:DNA-binding SARP family transcriptional activator
MNERIRELAEQATFRQFFMPKSNSVSALDKFNGTFTEQEAIEKFAELLIRECATAFEAEVDTWKEMDPYQSSMKRKGTQAIKQHFGVEQ